MANQTDTKAVTGVVSLSYANVWEPKSINGSAEKYSVSLIIPKSDKKTIAAINAAVDAATGSYTHLDVYKRQVSVQVISSGTGMLHEL